MSTRWRAVLPDDSEREFDLKTEQCGCHSLRTEHVHRIFDEHGTKLGGSHASLTEAVVQAFGEIKQIVAPGGFTMNEARGSARPLRLFKIGLNTTWYDQTSAIIVAADTEDAALEVVYARGCGHECDHTQGEVLTAETCQWRDPARRTITEIDCTKPSVVEVLFSSG